MSWSLHPHIVELGPTFHAATLVEMGSSCIWFKTCNSHIFFLRWTFMRISCRSKTRVIANRMLIAIGHDRKATSLKSLHTFTITWIWNVWLYWTHCKQSLSLKGWGGRFCLFGAWQHTTYAMRFIIISFWTRRQLEICVNNLNYTNMSFVRSGLL